MYDHDKYIYPANQNWVFSFVRNCLEYERKLFVGFQSRNSYGKPLFFFLIKIMIFIFVFLTLKTTGYILEFARTFIKISHEKYILLVKIEFPMGVGNMFKRTLELIWKYVLLCSLRFLSPGFV